MRTALALCIAGMAVQIGALSAAAAPVSLGMVVPDFTLRDQYDRTFRLGDHADSIIVLICGDRKGSKWTSAWGRAARATADSLRSASDSLRSRVVIRFVADLRGVPGLLHGYVKGKFKPPGKRANPVLLDWDGAMARIFGLRKHVANAFILDSRFVLGYAAAGEGRPEELAPFRVALRHMLVSSTSGAEP